MSPNIDIRETETGCWISCSMRWRGSPSRRSASSSMRRRRRSRGSSARRQAMRPPGPVPGADPPPSSGRAAIATGPRGGSAGSAGAPSRPRAGACPPPPSSIAPSPSGTIGRSRRLRQCCLTESTAKHPSRKHVDDVIVLPTWSDLKLPLYLDPQHSMIFFCMLVGGAPKKRSQQS